MPHYVLIAAQNRLPVPTRGFICARCTVALPVGYEQTTMLLILVRQDDPERRAIQVPLCEGCAQPFQRLAAIRLASDQLSPEGGVLRAAPYFPQALRWNQALEQLRAEAQVLERETLAWASDLLTVYFPNLDTVAETIQAEWHYQRGTARLAKEQAS